MSIVKEQEVFLYTIRRGTISIGVGFLPNLLILNLRCGMKIWSRNSQARELAEESGGELFGHSNGKIKRYMQKNAMEFGVLGRFMEARRS